jgi:hypothetical protein
MVTLRRWIGDVRLANSQHFFHDSPVAEGHPAQLSPVLSLTARDYVINRGKRELLMSKVTVQHRPTLLYFLRAGNPGPSRQSYYTTVLRPDNLLAQNCKKLASCATHQDPMTQRSPS